MKGRGSYPRPQKHRRIEERIAKIRRDLVAGGACSEMSPEVWNVVEEELLDELAELESFLLLGETSPYVRRGREAAATDRTALA